MSDKNNFSGTGEKSEKREKKFMIIGVIITLVIAVILAVLITCHQCNTDKGDLTNSRTPPDVSDFMIVFVDGVATLYWVDPSDVFLDHIEISWDPNGEKPVSIAGGTGKYILPGLNEGTVYNFTVKTVDKWGNKSAGKTGGTGKAYKLHRPDYAPASQIIGIKGTPVAGEVTMSWQNLDDSEYDHIEISYDPGHSAPIRLPKGVESKTLTSLVNGVEHTFYAVAVDANGNRKPVNNLGLFISDNPTSPESVYGRSSFGQIIVNWETPSDPDIDHFEIAHIPGGETMAVANRNEQNILLSDLNDYIKYEFTVYAVDSSGHRRPVTGAHLFRAHSDFSDDELDGMVTGRSVNGQIRLDWEDPQIAHFDHVEIVYDPLGESRSRTVAKGTETNIYTGLSDDLNHSFIAFGVDEDGNKQVIKGLRLSTPTVDVSPDDRSAIVRGKPLNGQIQLDWKNPALAGFDHFEVVIDPDNNAKSTTIPKNQSSHSYSDLSDDHEYSFLVYGVDAKGNKRPIYGVQLSTPQISGDARSGQSRGAQNAQSRTGQSQTGQSQGVAQNASRDDLYTRRDFENQISSQNASRTSTPQTTTIRPPRILAKPVLGEVTFIWNDPDDPEFDHIELTYSHGGDTPITENRGRETHTFTGLSDDVQYEFFVTAVFADGTRQSLGADVVIPSVITGMPTNGELSLEWTDPVNFNVDHIVIVHSGREHTRLVNRGAEKQTFAGLTDGQRYSFAVYAVDDVGKRHSIRAKFFEPITFKETWIPPALEGNLSPLDWDPVKDTAFGNSTIYALSFGYTANRTPCWVAGGDDGKIAYSLDFGITWIAVEDAYFGSYAINAICYANGRWIAGGKNGKMSWSTDAVKWNPIVGTYLHERNLNINTIIFDNNCWAAGGSGGTVIISEDNGSTWRLAATNAFGKPTADVTTIATHRGRWIAGGTTGELAYSDDNGHNWTTVGNNILGNFAINVIIYDQEHWFAAGYAQRVAWSNDGITWRPMARPFYILCMGYTNHRWVVGGQEGRMAWSGDKGITWNTDAAARDFFGRSWVEAIAYGMSPTGKVRWISAGQNGKITYADEKTSIDETAAEEDTEEETED